MNRVVFVCALVIVVSGSAPSFGGQTAGTTDVIAAVRAATAEQDIPRAESIVRQYQAANGSSSEALEALSWVARGALAARQFEAADKYARETYTLANAALSGRSLDADAHLQTALGAAIETEALARAGVGARSDAVYYLRGELEKYRDTAIHKRISKNLNLLSLEGEPAPKLEASEYLDRRVPAFSELKGQVVLLFFWAHWCPDCKAESPIIAKLLDKYRAQGLAIVAPTQRYGYVAGGKNVGPDEELKYIVQIRDTYYPFLRDQPVPVSEANHKQYGVASTPTIVLVDRQGLVRLYHPGRMTEQELETAITALLRPATAQN